MVTMSAFDLMGSIAYSLTTLPIPKGEMFHMYIVFGFEHFDELIVYTSCLSR